jgi:type I restriction enzyme R subunit
MLLTGFDSKYLNTLYVDKKLKYHGLIQAFSRTNRVLNDTKPHGNILDFRQQMAAVDEAIKLFSGMKEEEAKEIWLVKPAPVIIEEYKAAFEKLTHYMAAQQLPATPDAVHQLQGDSAKEGFIHSFKEVQRLKNQLEQYTDLSPEIKSEIETVIPPENLRAFRGAYIEIAKELRPSKQSSENPNTIGQQIDFEFVLFASAIVDFDYIMGLVAGLTNGKPSKEKMTAEQIISLLKSTANLMDEEEDLVNYIENLDTTRGYTQDEITENYKAFKKQNYQNELQAIANAHNLELTTLEAFIRRTLDLQRFDAPDFMDTVLAPLALGWRERAAKVEELKFILAPVIQSQADGR